MGDLTRGDTLNAGPPAESSPPVRLRARPGMRTIVIVLVVTLPLLTALVYGLTRDPRAIPSPLVGRAMPDFTLPLFQGGVLDTGTLRGKVLVVNFWASWCYPACYEEAPRLQRVWARYRQRGVVVIGVNIQDRESAAREFIRQFAQTFPNGMDRSGRISIDFGVYGVPETFIVNQDGIIAAKHVGAVLEEWMVEHIERLLGTAPLP